jgi:hypothetical protein
MALSPHNFTHLQPCSKWIRTFRKYGVILPFSGITLQQNILKISELLSDLWWMVKRQYSTPCNPCLKKFPFLRRNRVGIFKEINVQVRKNLPCDSRSVRRISLSFSPVMGLAALELNIHCLKTSLHKQRYVIFLSWKEEFYKKTVIYIYTYIYIYTHIYTNVLIIVVFKVYLKCVCVWNTKWYDIMCMSDWVNAGECIWF